MGKRGKRNPIPKKEIENRLLNRHEGNISLLEYTASTDYALFKCNVCGYEWNAITISVTRGNGCNECAKIRQRNKFAHSYDYVKNYIESFNFKLLSKEYINGREDLIIECPEGHITNKCFDSFKRKPTCAKCSQIKLNLSKRIPEETIMKYLKEDDFKFIGFPNGYSNRLSFISFECKHNHVTTCKLREYIKYRNCQICTRIKQSESQRGQGGSNWQGGKTELFPTIRKSIDQWKKDSIKSCNYKCVITGERFDDVHHLYSFNLIFNEAIKELQLDYQINAKLSDYTDDEVSLLRDKVIELHKKYPLGVSVRRDVHNLFHELYLSGNNTPSQWDDFVRRINSGEITITKIA